MVATAVSILRLPLSPEAMTLLLTCSAVAATAAVVMASVAVAYIANESLHARSTSGRRQL